MLGFTQSVAVMLSLPSTYWRTFLLPDRAMGTLRWILYWTLGLENLEFYTTPAVIVFFSK